MTTTTFIPGTTIAAAWLNDVDAATYNRTATSPFTITATTPNAWYWDYTNPDGAGQRRLKQTIPATVNMSGGGNVQGMGMFYHGSTSAATPNAGFAETNMIRMDYTVNSDAGKNVQIHMINGLLTVAADEAGSGVEHAGMIYTARATGPTAGTAAIGQWGLDIHVEKNASVLDGKMVGVEIGIHKVPTLGAAKCRGIDLWSGDRSAATSTTRAGDAIYIQGTAGWTNFLKFIHTDSATTVVQLDQNANLTLNCASGSMVHTWATTQVSTSNTLTLTSKDGASANCNLVLQSASSGHTIGSTTNQHVILKQNNNEVFRLIDGFLLASVAGVESTGAKSAALGANCPAVTETAPYKWIKARTSDASTVYFPVWK